MNPFLQARLYTFIDTGYLDGRSPADLAAQLCDGGSDVLQVRAKGWNSVETLKLAETVKSVTDRAKVTLVINDHPEIARQLDADAVHLGQEDFFEGGRKKSSDVTGQPPRFRLGLSTHAPDQAEKAIAAQPDYIAIGPIFATPTKPGRLGVTLDYVRWAANHVTIPWFAIGGIHLGNLEDVLAAGARRICVVSAILRAPDVAKACQEFKNRLASAR